MSEPRLLRKPLSFERANLVGLPQREPDIVEAVQQAVLAKCVDFERVFAAVGRAHALRIEIDRQLIAVERIGLVEQVIDLLLSQSDRQHAVLEAVVEEDIGKAGRDQRTKTVLLQRPRRVFARTATTEVLACE